MEPAEYGAPALSYESVSRLMASLGPPPRRPNIIYLICPYNDRPAWERWIADQFTSGNPFSWVRIAWEDSEHGRQIYPCPGLFILWSDKSLSWTPFESKLSEKPLTTAAECGKMDASGKGLATLSDS